ncbi:D-beta-hydroxybutyrate dehydrogenase, mitochondrial-like [Saccoglossus kowalevskii]
MSKEVCVFVGGFIAIIVLLAIQFVSNFTVCMYVICVIAGVTTICCLILILLRSGKVSIEGKIVFITGCDTGFGHELAKRLDSIGMVVFAGCLLGDGEGALSLISHCSDRLRIVQVDVTSDESVRISRKVVEEHILKLEEGIWAVVNNAGIWTWGELEWGKVEVHKRLAEVNLYGMVRITQTFLPLVRRAKGRIINVTSMVGRWTPPGNGMYCMTKYAAESFSDALRNEMYPWGVKVSMIEPGLYARATNIGHSNPEIFHRLCEELWDGMTDDVKREYGIEHYTSHVQYLVEQLKQTLPNCNDVIDVMTHAIISKEPKHRYLVGSFYDTHFMTLFHQYVPSFISDLRYQRFYSEFCTPAALRDKQT